VPLITYSDSAESVKPSDLDGFFVGWPSAPTRERRLDLLSCSDVVSVAFDDALIVGFATAVSDGVLAAYITFLEVLPTHQHRGIGTRLVASLLRQLDDLYMIDVACDTELEPFYARCGFRTLDRAMGIRRREKIS
jgi:ribosomal protein S18 acetylase RimI-like enzyme